jgi:glycolate oxidase iron-sulfur subunit
VVSRAAPGALGLDPEELVACVACGLCLPHCPTFRVTGLEIASPRGRIAAMRAVEGGDLPVDRDFVRAMEECVQCRGCESACPSSVPFGSLMETTRAAIRRQPRRRVHRRVAEWFAYRIVLPRHRILVALTWLLAVAQRLHLVPRRAAIPRLTARSLRPLRPGSPPGDSADVEAWLFTGCVMDAWMRDTHRSAVAVLRSVGVDPSVPGRGGDCCGALHLHAGRHDEAVRLAHRVMASMPGPAPILVDSAGCGAVMKDYGRLVGTPGAAAFAARVRDFSEGVAALGPPPLRSTGRRVVVQDPCHLRHVQHAHGAVRSMLAPAFEIAETDDDGLCCGAGGAYSLQHPHLAAAARERKVEALRRAAGDAKLLVASANPGCLMHLRAAGVNAWHPADLLARALEA